jgi:hypothetical protein
LRLAWATYQVPSQSEIHRENLSFKKKSGHGKAHLKPQAVWRWRQENHKFEASPLWLKNKRTGDLVQVVESTKP